LKCFSLFIIVLHYVNFNTQQFSTFSMRDKLLTNIQLNTGNFEYACFY